MKGIKIDTTAKTITAIEIEPGLNGLYQAINCQTVDRLVLDGQNDLWFDDEGLFANPSPGAFRLRGWDGQIVGNALIMGYTDEGETIDTTLEAYQFYPLVRFLN